MSSAHLWHWIFFMCKIAQGKRTVQPLTINWYNKRNRTKEGDMMNIGIIGGGAVGLLYASQLSKRFAVTLYVKRQEQLQLLKEQGLTVLHSENGKETRNVGVMKWEKDVPLKDNLIIVATKQYGLTAILPVLKMCSRDQSILFLQNGMSHIDLLKQFSKPQILLGVVEHGVKKINDCTVMWTGKGRTKIAGYPVTKKDRQAALFMNSWSDSIGVNFPLEVCMDYYGMMIEKLLVNAIINPLTAIFDVRNGELLSNKYYQNCMKRLYNEMGFLVQTDNREHMWNHICSICEKTSENSSSMKRDINAGRETEVDAILGYMINLAEKQGKLVPLTEFIYEAVKGLQNDASC
ncbi:2-dehydropantoate 2-reductase [Sutcliffiella horikoshii]|uniref:2-dehydropantoate 2-reductase n=2 Tax=Sutcliffiella horikoshii TaxID=79883 RepID=A0A5D4T616_9BACI|nr:2-dehydropantoate 2-reductase [Sutcliffiella horikoshii]